VAEEQPLFSVGLLSSPEALKPQIAMVTPAGSSSAVPGRTQSSSTLLACPPGSRCSLVSPWWIQFACHITNTKSTLPGFTQRSASLSEGLTSAADKHRSDRKWETP